MSAENEAIIRYWVEEVWNQKRAEVIDELVSPECIARGMGPNGTDLVGPEGFKGAHALFVGAFPDLQITIGPMVVSGDMVASQLTCTATHKGDHLGMPATGKQVQFPAMTIARLKDGKIVEGWNCIDLLTAFQQIGALKVSESMP